MTTVAYAPGVKELFRAWRGRGRVAYTPSNPPALGDTVKPEITNVTPAEGVELNPSSGVVGFDLTDASGNLTRTNVYAYYPSLRTFEVVWFGSPIAPYFAGGFGPQYAGTRAVITNGFRFATVIRLGGWPGAPIIVCDPVDDAGNGSI